MENRNKQANDARFYCGPGFGSASLSGAGGGYGFGKIDDRIAQQTLEKAWELGIRVFDTAPIYGFGVAEERLGLYLPPEALIIDKGGISWHSNKRVNLSNDPQVIEDMFFASLKRLRREKIHSYLIHWPDPQVDIRKPFEVLLRLKNENWVDFVGLSNPSLDDFHKVQDLGAVDIVQLEAHFFETSKMRALLETIERMDVFRRPWITGWGTLNKGILTGRVFKNRQFDPDDARSWAPWWKKLNLSKLIEEAQPFLDLARELSLQPATLALIFSSDVLGVDCPLLGIKSPSDLVFLEELRLLDKTQKKVAIEALLALQKT
jgi:myo-inositol catabolism protein IolS